MTMRHLALLLVTACLLFSSAALAQTETATLSGTVMDKSGAIIPDAKVQVTNSETNATINTVTNKSGIYLVPALRPGRYRIITTKEGFKQVVVTDVILNVQDTVSRNFNLEVGAASESITVTADAARVNTTDAAVSTVVDRNFAENLPMNGRSFQTLIQLTPGVVAVTSNTADSGQFSVNGQRAASNYWMVDGVGANIGTGSGLSVSGSGNGLAGALGSFSALGGTNSLVSVDAMQEFRIQTSTYAPEFGRTPGAQISIVTRSGSNQFHGTLFDFFRNDALDAGDWFNGYKNDPPLPKAKERQNDFGGTFGGPVLKDRTFFFFSYEGLRLRLPRTALTTVPDLTARLNATPSMQPILNAFPLPNGNDDLMSGIAELNASFSNQASLDAYSLRLDHKASDNLTLFGRYNYSPSNIVQRGEGVFALSATSPTRINVQTATAGINWAISPITTNELRFNYSRTGASSFVQLDTFGGAVPLSTLPIPSPYTPANSFFFANIFSLQQGLLYAGQLPENLQRQFNVVDGVSIQRGSHTLKVGLDFRRLSPVFTPSLYTQGVYFLDVPSAENGIVALSSAESNLKTGFLFRNLGAYAQDTWHVTPRLTLTYGLRWDVDWVPASLQGANFPAVTGFNLSDLSNLALEPSGTSAYQTKYGNIAPRFGFAYQVRQNAGSETVIRGGIGIFYDLASSELGNLILTGSYPFGGEHFNFGGTFPLDPAAAAPPQVSPPNPANPGILLSINPGLELPYTLEWNTSVEQSLGQRQTLRASYVGAVGRRLLQTTEVLNPNPTFTESVLVTNAGTSDYHALQLQFQRQLSHGLQALVSYTWSHSIDTGSAGSPAVASNVLLPGAVNANRAPSDFDIRHSVSAGLTYQLPSPRFVKIFLFRDWSVESVFQARSAAPVDITDINFFGLFSNGLIGDTRPDLVPGISPYLYGPEFPGGKAFNPAAFTSPPVDPITGFPIRQGTTPRNLLRGFGATQWDLAVHRDFPIHESLKLQVRAELFNILNHPNFGAPNGQFGSGDFGISTQMLGQSLNNRNLGNGGFDPLYQVGGPRSVQFALKLSF